MIKQPQTWKDILKKRNVEPDEHDACGHNWKVVGQKGGTATPIKTYGKPQGVGTFRRTASSACVTGFHRTPKVVYYKCNNCNIKGRKTIGEDPDVVLDNKYRGLTCDEIIVRDIIE